MNALEKNRVSRGRRVQNALVNNIVWVLLAIFIVAFIIISPRYFNPAQNPQVYINIPMQSAAMGLLAIGLAGTLLIGDIDLSTTGIMAMSAAAGILISLNTGLPAALTILLIVGIGAGFGWVNGMLIAKLKTVALIETLAMNTTLAGLVLALTRGQTIMVADPLYKAFGQGKLFGQLPYLVIVMVAAYIVIWIIWRKTALGRGLFAVGGNTTAARVSGINVDRTRIAAFTISGLCAGLAGAMLSAKMASINSTFGSSYSMDVIAAAVIGGTSLSGGIGRVSGVLGGVILLNFIQVGLQVMGLDAYYVQMATGLIIMLAVVIDSFRARYQAKGV